MSAQDLHTDREGFVSENLLRKDNGTPMGTHVIPSSTQKSIRSSVRQSGSFRFVTDYPRSHQTLLANRRAITGWCWSGNGPIESIQLRIDGRHEVSCRRGYPRLDAIGQGIAIADALSIGYQFEFDPSHLTPGAHDFEFVASAGGETVSWNIRTYHTGDDASCHVSDIFIDIVSYCNLRCSMCPQGNLEGLKHERAIGVMAPSLLNRILHRLRLYDYLTGQVNLYNWGDPLLHPQLDECLEVCATHGQRSILSSNLAMSEQHIRRLLRGRTDLLIVSISGMTQEIYGRNHQGGRIEQVLDNIRTVASTSGAVGTVLLKYLVFDYNRHEVEEARAFAQTHGLQFGAYRGAIPSVETANVRSRNEGYAADSDQFVSTSPPHATACRTCPQESTIVIDHQGDLEVCAMAWQHRFGASALEVDLTHYLIGKMDNATCSACLSGGYAHYRHYEVIDPELLEVALPSHDAG